MDKTLCQKCFHYAACKEIDLSGAIGNPEMENEPCDHFIDAERVKIQDKAQWVESVSVYSDSAYVNYNCSCCNYLGKVKRYNKSDWENYFSEHYRDDLKLYKFCEGCGSVMDILVAVKEK